METSTKRARTDVIAATVFTSIRQRNADRTMTEISLNTNHCPHSRTYPEQDVIAAEFVLLRGRSATLSPWPPQARPPHEALGDAGFARQCAAGDGGKTAPATCHSAPLKAAP